MQNIRQFRDLIIDPTLRDADLYSCDASNLMLGTAMIESNVSAFAQYGGGPALGFFQMEPVTFNDIFHRYLEREDKHRLKTVVRDVMISNKEPLSQLCTNLPFAVLLARIKYAMIPDAIPSDARGQARYWKQHYNTEEGAGTVSDYMRVWKRWHAYSGSV